MKKRLFTVHSLKGGVGKTSIAITIALLEKRAERNPLLIDADLTGTSIIALTDRIDNKRVKYLNEYLLASPMKYREIRSKLPDEYFVTMYDGKPHSFTCIASSADCNDVKDIIPLISQEAYLGYFKTRILELIDSLFKKHNSIIIDLSPGHFGLSHSLLYHDEKLKSNISWQRLMICTDDDVDWYSLGCCMDELKNAKRMKVIYNKFSRKFKHENIEIDNPAQCLKMYLDADIKTRFPETKALKCKVARFVQGFIMTEIANYVDNERLKHRVVPRQSILTIGEITDEEKWVSEIVEIVGGI